MSVSPIPIRNLYYLLCYAWDRLKEGEVVDVSRLPSTELADLFAFVLIGGVQHLARRGIEQGYDSREEELAGIRGRVNTLSSARRLLIQHGRAACTFDELSTNTLANQIVKSTLRVLAEVPTLDKTLRTKSISLCGNLRGIDNINVTLQSFRRVQLHGNNRFYKFLLSVCELIHSAWLVNQGAGSYRFRDFIRDEKKMGLVFQNFVFNFFRIECPDLHVRRERIGWKAVSELDPELSLLPRMETDISIRKGNRKIIIDTKYYQETLSQYYDAEKLHSSNLYQMLSYLTNSERAEGEEVEGILLYPTVDRHLNARYTIHGFPIRFQTVDLGQDWTKIRDDLKQLIN